MSDKSCSPGLKMALRFNALQKTITKNRDCYKTYFFGDPFAGNSRQGRLISDGFSWLPDS